MKRKCVLEVSFEFHPEQYGEELKSKYSPLAIIEKEVGRKASSKRLENGVYTIRWNFTDVHDAVWPFLRVCTIDPWERTCKLITGAEQR